MKRKWLRILAVLGIALVFPLTGSAEGLLDLGRACELTVNAVDPGNRLTPENQEFAEDLDSAGVVVDLYKVADAVKEEGFDSYRYKLLDSFGNLEIRKDMNNEEWHLLAQQAAAIALEDNGGNVTSVVTGAPAGQPITQEDSGSDLCAGLYLVIARGENVGEYVMPVTDEDGRQGIATLAWSDEYVYTFAPELISLPGLIGNDETGSGEEPGGSGPDTSHGDEDGGEVNRNSGYQWVYDPKVNLKPERALRFGSLEIVKVLSSYETEAWKNQELVLEEIRENAVFVFGIEAELNGRNVYSDVLTVSFDEPGRRVLLVEKLPVGAEVTVTELYSGSGYSPEGEKTKTLTIIAKETVSAEFVNRYDGRHTGGHGITNQFTYDGTEGKWDLIQIR